MHPSLSQSRRVYTLQSTMETLQRQQHQQQEEEQHKHPQKEGGQYHRPHQQDRGGTGRRLSALDLFQKSFGIDEPADNSDLHITSVTKNASTMCSSTPLTVTSLLQSKDCAPTQKNIVAEIPTPQIAPPAALTSEESSKAETNDNSVNNRHQHNANEDDEEDDLSESDLNAIYAAAAKVGGGDISSNSNNNSSNNASTGRRRSSLRSSFSLYMTSGLNVPSMLQTYVNKTRRSFTEVARRSFTSIPLIGNSAATNTNKNIGKNSKSGNNVKSTNSPSPTNRTRRRSFTQLLSSKRRSFTEFMGLTGPPTASVSSTTTTTAPTEPDYTSSQPQHQKQSSELNQRKRSWWLMTPREIVSSCVGFGSSNTTGELERDLSIASSTSTTTLSADASTGSADDGMESLLHQSCRLYSQTTAVVGAALNADPSGARRRWVSSRGLKKRRIDCYSLPLNIALENQASFEVIRLLTDAAPDVLVEPDGSEGCASLSVALTHVKDRSVLREIIHLFLQKNPNCISHADKRSNYPLHIACNRGGWCDVEMVQLLTKKYPSAITKRNFHGYTPLDVAQRAGNLADNDSVVDYLQQVSFDVLEEGADHLESDESF